ncbi:PTS transporter subunit EIIA [Listeria rocourtiae]|uniref:fructose-specific PTS transporter subunit EIIC n=1 Tax=Listeria rocourtiae TaxID=647910 RepID=UPI0016283B3C|nr:fructose-specific PTS transporter subunit EIIC [Listeria rocourtiae]MBC1435025.1 PTS transporter subunit EIIA [Listeria rocourtiae]
MNLVDATQKELIFLDQNFQNREEVFQFLAQKLFENGKVSNKEEYLKAIYEREEISATGFENGLAIPHGKSTTVREAAFAVLRLNKPLDNYPSLDPDNKVDIIFMMAIPSAEAGNTHLDVLAKLATLLNDSDYIQKFRAASSVEEILSLLSETKEVATQQTNFDKTIVAVTSCASGVAHTYMAADALEKAGRELGVNVYVEKQGANGIEDRHTSNRLKEADAAIFAVDVAVKESERFNHLPIEKTAVKDPLKNATLIIQRALKKAESIEKSEYTEQAEVFVQDGKPTFKRMIDDAKRHLMTGVSYMLPFVVAGGMILTIGLLLGKIQENAFTQAAIDVGVLIFSLMIPVISGYIAYSIADKPGIVVGMAGGLISREIGAGFLGGILAGFIAGYIVNRLKKIPMHAYLAQLKPIIIIPLVGSGLIALFMYAVGAPIAELTKLLENGLMSLQGGNLILLGVIIGAMMAVDMGGPINKVAFAFCVGLLDQNIAAPMAACWIGIMTPPVGLALATVLAPKKFSQGERASQTSTVVMGLTGITEGAIPFAVADPWRVILSIVVGSAVGGGLALGLGSEAAIPSGGIFVVPFFHEPIMFMIAFIVGIFVTALMAILLKKEYVEVK